MTAPIFSKRRWSFIQLLNSWQVTKILYEFYRPFTYLSLINVVNFKNMIHKWSLRLKYVFYLLFKWMVTYYVRSRGIFSVYLNICLITKLFFLKVSNPFPNKPLYLCVCSTSLLKTLLEKGETACNKQFLLFPMSNFSFSQSIFYPFGELLPILHEI